MSGSPVTTDPTLIMLINMTIVFVVLYLLGLVIQLIHLIDPTKNKEQPIISELPDVSSVQQESAASAALSMEEKELAAVVTTAIMATGYQNVKINSIKKL